MGYKPTNKIQPKSTFPIWTCVLVRVHCTVQLLFTFLAVGTVLFEMRVVFASTVPYIVESRTVIKFNYSRII